MIMDLWYDDSARVKVDTIIYHQDQDSQHLHLCYYQQEVTSL
jgi:hypothetical protein